MPKISPDTPGAMTALMHATDWSRSALGAPDGWPLALRSPLGICLDSSFPIAIYWGPERALLYNEAWSPILGEKHPWALGRPAREVWPEIWDTIGPMFEQVYDTGTATRSHDQLLPMRRRGFTEECWFDYTFSPIRGDDGTVQGVFNAVIETTFRHIGERRTRLLRDLGEQAARAGGADAVCRLAADALATDPDDLPFALLYLIDDDGQARLAAATGLPQGSVAAPSQVRRGGGRVTWPIAQALEQPGGLLVEALAERWGTALQCGPWPEHCERALLVPLAGSGAAVASGVLVAGISPRLALDGEYRAFVERAASSIGAAIAAARTIEQERARAEALAELDRAKTTFFSNISHELRTPLTLMLGPIEELLQERPDPKLQLQLTLARRNGLRLQRLVNTLLDFSRIEAGRMQASFEPTDLAAATADLASVFRAAIERAGLTLRVDCPRLPEPVFVDRAMWEKIVFNLLSNAFKFTLSGTIRVSLLADGRAARLLVGDTGIGVPAAEQARLFERFYRVEGAQGRTIEGSGIGLALVQELARLHGGEASVSSEPGLGSEFSVRIPFGHAHLPAAEVRAVSPTATTPVVQAWLDEADAWAGEHDSAPGEWSDSGFGLLEARPPSASASASDTEAAQPARVLVVDDNADMRGYLARLLGRDHEVVWAADGVQALELARALRPDLIVTDSMMPRLDGLGLLHALRADAALASTPVILLSARAGDEARIDGLAAGADDYMTKPFHARELLARVAGLLALTRARRALAATHTALHESEARHRLLVELNEATQALSEPDDILAATARLLGTAMGADRCLYARIHEDDNAVDVFGTWVRDADVERTEGRFVLDDFGGDHVALYRAGLPFVVDDIEADPRLAPHRALYRALGTAANLSVGMLQDGKLVAALAVHQRSPRHWTDAEVRIVRDVAARSWETLRRARVQRELAEREQRFRQLAEAMPQIVYVIDAEGQLEYVNSQWQGVTGQGVMELDLDRAVHADDLPLLRAHWKRARAEGSSLAVDFRLRRRDGVHEWFLTRAMPVRDTRGHVVRWFGTSTNIDLQKRHAEELMRTHDELQRVDQRKDKFIATLAHELRNPLAPLSHAVTLLQRGPDAQAVGRLHAMMQRQIDTLVRLVDDLLEVARIKSGKIALRREPLDLAEVIDSAVEGSRALVDSAGLRLERQIDLDGVVVDGDALRLVQVFTNLLHNAVKYSAAGGTITLRGHREAQHAAITLTDQGLGIAPELLPRVFDFFVQGPSAESHNSSGLGIGLGLVKTMVTLHGGEVEARSAGPGAGSEFVVRLPLGTRAAATPRRDAPVVADPTGAAAEPVDVLICDDNRDAADSLGELLRALGARPRVVYDGASAVEAARHAPPRLVLLDLGMPGMDGFESLRALRDVPRGAAMTIAALTGWAQQRDRMRTDAAGFDLHLVKPVEVQVLQNLLASLRLESSPDR